MKIQKLSASADKWLIAPDGSWLLFQLKKYKQDIGPTLFWEDVRKVAACLWAQAAADQTLSPPRSTLLFISPTSGCNHMRDRVSRFHVTDRYGNVKYADETTPAANLLEVKILDSRDESLHEFLDTLDAVKLFKFFWGELMQPRVSGDSHAPTGAGRGRGRGRGAK